MSTTETPRRPDGIDLGAALAILASLAVAAIVWRYAPSGPLPTHLDFQGRVDGWTSRGGVAGFIAIAAAFFGLIYLLIGAMTLRAGAEGSRQGNVRSARLVLVAVQVMLTAVVAIMAFGGATAPQLGGGRLMTAALALIFLVVGALIGKAGPNPFVGVRTYWSLRSRLAWDKSNRLAGRLFFWIGLVALPISPFAPPQLLTPMLIIGILAAGAASVFESWRVWRSDPDRQHA